MKIDESSSFSNLKRKNYFRFFSLSILFLFFSASLSVFSNSSQQESDYIIIKSEKTAQDLFADANHLVSEGEYIKALPIYNYAYDIAKDKQLKKEIIIAKRKAERLLEKKLAEKRKQGQEKIRVLYQQAKQAYSDNNFDRAESLFQQILEIDPNHSVAENFINQHIPAKRQQLKAQAQSQKERQARLAKEKAEKEARQKKLVAERKAEEAEQQAQRAKQEKINSLYHQAKVAYSNNNLGQAKSLFTQILTVDPNHKIADAYLNRHLPNKRQQLKEAAQREKERQAELARREAEQQKQEKINSLYSQAKSAYSAENLDQAEAIFEKILKIDPEHKRAKTYLNNYIPAKRQQLKEAAQRQKERQARLARERIEREEKKQRLEAQRSKQEKINNLYHQAKVAYSNNNLNQAESIFKQILTVDPNHKIADAYLNRHLPNKRQQLKEAAQREKERQAELARREAEQQKQEKINNLYHQAKVYYTQRKLYNAEIIFKQILEIDPGHSGAKAYLEKIEIIRERKEQ